MHNLIKNTSIIFGILILTSLSGFQYGPMNVQSADAAGLNQIAGWRSSQYGDYLSTGHDQSDPAYWISVAQQMTAKFPGFTPGGVLVIGEIDGAPGTATSTFLPFPKPAGTYPNVNFGSTDKIEPLLDAYDSAGLKVYLQVESADADISMLMDLIMDRYQHHPSVIGFGVDAEWYHEAQYPGWGRPLTDSEVNAWAAQIKTFDPDYDLLVKHWDWSYLSNARPDNVLFLTDSENIGSLSATINEYVSWVDHFGDAQVGFQIGYPSDQSWWSNLNDPAAEIMNSVIAARPNANIGAIFWVDFSVLEAFPDIIPDDDSESLPTVRVHDVTQVEGDSGTSDFVFAVTRSANTPAMSVQYSTEDNTAIAPTDYTSLPPTTLNFASGGPLTQTIKVPVNGDTAVERNEKFYVNLLNCSGCTITDAQGTAYVKNDDSESLPTVRVHDVTQVEGDSGTSDFVFTVTRSANTPAMSVQYSTEDNTAIAPTDYTSLPPTTLNFASGGPLTQTIKVPVNGDTAVERNEKFYVNLLNCSGCTITDAQGITYLKNDDSESLPTVRVHDVTQVEGDSGTSDFVFAVTRSANTPAMSVQYSTEDNTAIAPTDYTSLPPTTLNFASGGPLTQTITVPVNGDTIVEKNEKFYVNLSNCISCTINDAQGTAYLKNDDFESNQNNGIFSDDFESGFSKWTETGEGDWILKSPSEVQVPGHSSNLVAHSDNCDSTCTITMSDPINLSSYSSATLSFWRFVDDSLDNGEYLKVELYDGNQWNTIFNWTNQSGDDNTWHQETVNLDSYIGTSDFNVRFVTQESSGLEEVEIDDVVINTTGLPSPPLNTDTAGLNQIAGWRSSQYGDYLSTGHDQSDPAYWISVAQQMTAKFPGFTPGGVLVIGEIDGAPGTATSTFLPFPKPAGTYPNVNFGSTDKIEPLLDAYDSAGLKVYLQVESADADISMLMDLIMDRYQHHPSVIGFGVDAEWYHEAQYPGWGRPLTDSEVNAWAAQIKTFDPDYDLLVKHWDWSYLSNARPDNVLFLTDSENIGSLSATINEYVSWVDHFGDAQVGFQIGYPSDQSWWSNLNDPAAEIMNSVIAARPNANIGAIFWVDFSVLEAFPDT